MSDSETHSTNTYNVPFQRSQSADLAPRTPPRLGLSMTQSSGTLPTMGSPNSFQRRTFESARNFRETVNSAIRQFEPLVTTARNARQNAMAAITITELLSRQHSVPTQRSPPTTPNQSNENNDNQQPTSLNHVTINFDEQPVAQVSQNSLANSRESLGRDQHVVGIPVNENADNNNQNQDNLDQVINHLEAHETLQVIFKYIPFLLILIAKAVYDYHENIFILIIFFGTFSHANSIVKQQTLKRARRSCWPLALQLLYIAACMLAIHFFFEDNLHNFNVVLNVVLIRTFSHPLTVMNLLWIVTVTDFTLKLVTVAIKILMTMLPDKVIEFKKRGKYYLFVEACSQFYRSIATIQPWLYYLLESYQGPEKIVAVFLSAFYMISKGSDLMSKMKLVKFAILKVIQTVTLGTSPSKEQIQTAGDHCPICHDAYDTPVMLECRHIFCEGCVSTWFDREQTCPLCRAKIVDDPSWRDGSTSFFIQLF